MITDWISCPRAGIRGQPHNSTYPSYSISHAGCWELYNTVPSELVIIAWSDPFPFSLFPPAGSAVPDLESNWPAKVTLNTLPSPWKLSFSSSCRGNSSEPPPVPGDRCSDPFFRGDPLMPCCSPAEVVVLICGGHIIRKELSIAFFLYLSLVLCYLLIIIIAPK